MKNALILMLCLVSILMSESCKKNTTALKAPIVIKSFSPASGATGDQVLIVGSGFSVYASDSKIFFNGVQAVITSLSDTLITTNVPPSATTGKISFTLDGDNATSTTDFIILSLPGSWVRKADAPFLPRSLASGFTIGNKGFVGAGTHSTDTALLIDWWEYDPATDQWTSRTAIPFSGGFTQGASFGINDKGYLGVGISNLIPTRQLWQYDTTTNIWVRKTDCPDPGSYYAFGVSVGNKGYESTSFDWWEYDPATDQWTPNSPSPGEGTLATGLGINNKIYCLGTDSSWREYDPAVDQWTRKSDYPGSFRGYSGGTTGFTIANKGYLVGTTECWAYDPVLDQWTRQAFFADSRVAGVAFSIAGKGYYTTGSDADGNDQNDVWEFTPSN